MLHHAPSHSVVLQAVDPLALRELLPHSKLLAHKDYNIAVHLTEQSARVLRNLGYAPPAPIMTDYDWPGKYTPFAHQKEMARFWTEHKRGFNLSDPGTCKTAAALWAADYLMNIGELQKVLILAPLSTIERVWTQDIFDTLMHRRSVILHGTREKRFKMLDADVDFYILNHDGVKIGDLARALRKRMDIGLVIVDEGDFFCEARTDKFKSLSGMLRPDQRLWWQTGTPAANKPTQAWAQARIVNPAAAPEYFGTFQRQTMVQITPFKWAPREGAEAIVYRTLQPAIRFKKADCQDLPPVVTLERQAQMSAMQRKAFDDMRHEMQLEMASGVKITAVNAADKLGKMRQVLLGAVKDPLTGDYHVLDHKPRLDELRRAILGASAKAIVIVPFKGIIETLAKELGEDWSVGVLNGDVTPRERDRIVKEFKSGPDPHVLLCHPQVMSHGLNLVEADTTIFYGPIYSNAQYRQVIERNNRAGQTRSMTVVRIAAHPVEWEIYKLVDTKQITQDSILNLYTRILKV
jgi:SNF2 family DNA or RNA helicase